MILYTNSTYVQTEPIITMRIHLFENIRVGFFNNIR